MNKPIIKRLTELEKEFFRDVWADITYNDGRKERLKIIDVLNFYTNGKTPPKITDRTVTSPPLPVRDGHRDPHFCLDHNRGPTMLPGAASSGWQSSDEGCVSPGGVGVRG